MTEIVDHPDKPGWWRHEPRKPKPCGVCGRTTVWIWADLMYWCMTDDKEHREWGPSE